MPPAGSGRPAWQRREELETIIHVLKWEFTEKAKRKRGRIFTPPRWPQLGLKGVRPGHEIYFDKDVTAYGTFGRRLIEKIISAINQLRTEHS